MSEDTKLTQGETDPANGDGNGGETNGDKMPDNNQLAYETYKKALSQRHAFKEENLALKAELETSKQRDLEAEGKLKEKADYWQQRATEFEDKFTKTTAKFGWTQVKSQLSNELIKNGCVDSEVAISLINKEELSAVSVDDDFSVNPKDLERIVDGLKRDERTQRIKLFGKPKGVNDLVPNGNEDFKEPEEDLSKLTSDQLVARLKG